MKTFKYIVSDELGLHARPAGILSKQAKNYQSDITISVGDKSADAKKIFALMGLGVKQGDTITVAVSGPDENSACSDLEAFCKENI